ncbi:MAG: fatty acid desaturase [Hyphomicrobiaceae bacterium]
MNSDNLSLKSQMRACDWIDVLNQYRRPDAMRGTYELIVTAIPLILLWGLAWFALDISFWLTLLLTIPAAGFLVRLFMIQHDCGHGAFFRRRSTNDWVGRIIGIFTLTPYDVWRRSHAVHHATTGNLDLRGIGDIHTLTVAEFQASNWRERLLYRLYRHPLVLLVLGPGYLFLLQNRLPLGFMSAGWRYWLSAMITNAGIALFIVIMILAVGIKPFVAVHLPIVLLASSIGVWLFYIQHQFEDAHWEHQTDWNVHDAALEGSSYYDLPVVLRWFTANIGMHHVHHLCSRIPYYRLPDVLRDHPKLGDFKRITLFESFQYAQLQLWDEGKKRLISFKDLKKR